MMVSLSAPGKYIQGAGAIEKLESVLWSFGREVMVLCGKRTGAEMEEKLKKTLDGNLHLHIEPFGGEVTQAEAERLSSYAIEHQIDVIIGIGGGKVLDTAKYAADLSERPVIIMPTSAASDAPCSAMAVIYDDKGTYVDALITKRNPDVVLVDTQLVLTASKKLLLAGMGDAFATYYEARACKLAGAKNTYGCDSSEAGFAIAKLCKDILLQYGEEAVKDHEEGRLTPAFEKVVEANIYLSGVGFENNGCAVAHGIYNGMTAAVRPFSVYHGIGVAYGTLIQLLLEQEEAKGAEKVAALEEWEETIRFYKAVGLPTKLADLGIDADDESLLEAISQAVLTSCSLAQNMPFTVTASMIRQAMEGLEKRVI
ncbi:MAG: glycerol dehydrogenase [Firmicutes bacterium]|nr:glycerol dehydrogenase [Bacillota bacterium]